MANGPARAGRRKIVIMMMTRRKDLLGFTGIVYRFFFCL
jgi:hypothetical protein